MAKNDDLDIFVKKFIDISKNKLNDLDEKIKQNEKINKTKENIKDYIDKIKNDENIKETKENVKGYIDKIRDNENLKETKENIKYYIKRKYDDYKNIIRDVQLNKLIEKAYNNLDLNDNEILSILEDIKKIENRINNHYNEGINVINVGLLKAGKSELFNAISDKEIFETGVVRTTIENKKNKLEEYNLIDTPGLDANFDDSKTAFEGYKDADIMIFVHNCIDGELNKIEIDAIKSIIDMVGNKKAFFNSTILAVSHVDQLDSDDEKNGILNIINKQINDIFEEDFKYVIGVNSVGYIKGIKNNKQLLIQDSNILMLKDMILDLLKNNQSCFNFGINFSIDKVISDIEKKVFELENKKSFMENDLSGYIDIYEFKNKVNQISKQALENITFDLKEYEPVCPTFKLRASTGNAQKSTYKAKEEGRKQWNIIYRQIMTSASQESVKVVNYYSEYLNNRKGSGVILLSSYNNIKQIYYNVLKGQGEYSEGLCLDGNRVDFSQYDRDLKYYLKDIDYDTFPNYSPGVVEHKEMINGIFKKYKTYYLWSFEDSINQIKRIYKQMIDERIPVELYEDCSDSYKYQTKRNVELFKEKVDLLIKNFEEKANIINKNIDLKKDNINKISKSIELLKMIKTNLSDLKIEN